MLRVSFTTRLMFSEPISFTSSKGQPKRGYTSSKIKLASVSAILSGTAKASGHPLYQSKKAIMYLFPERAFGYGPDKSRLSFSIVYGDISAFCNNGLTF